MYRFILNKSKALALIIFAMVVGGNRDLAGALGGLGLEHPREQAETRIGAAEIRVDVEPVELRGAGGGSGADGVADDAAAVTSYQNDPARIDGGEQQLWDGVVADHLALHIRREIIEVAGYGISKQAVEGRE